MQKSEFIKGGKNDEHRRPFHKEGASLCQAFLEAEEAYRDGELTGDLARGMSMVTQIRSVSVGAESTGTGTVSLPCPR